MRRLSILVATLAALAAGVVVDATIAPTRADEPGAEPAKDGEKAGPTVAPRYEPVPCDVLLMLSGRELGMMRPCGCSDPQRGGLPRRAALFEDASRLAKAWGAVSIGDTLARAAVMKQNDFKAELFRASLDAMRYSGSVLSPDDLSPFWTFLSQPYGVPQGNPLPPLNVKIKRSGPLGVLAADAEKSILRFTLGDLKVRVVSIADPTTADALVPMDVADAVVPPGMAMDALTKEPGLLVVAAHVFREDLALIAKAAGEKADLAIVVDVRGEAVQRAPVKDRPMDKPLLVTFDSHGKEVALVRLVRGAKGWVASWDPVPLDPPYDEGESKARKAVDALFDLYRDNLRKEKLLESFGAVADRGPTYVGDAACASCHKAIHEQWSQTGHAVAFEALKANRADVDPECVGCHVVGWSQDVQGIWGRVESGFATAETTPLRLNVQCENCHGPGSDHVKAPKDRTLFGAHGTPGKVWKAVPQKACVTCHDPENSVHFDYEEYLPIVDHRDVPKDQRTNDPPK